MAAGNGPAREDWSAFQLKPSKHACRICASKFLSQGSLCSASKQSFSKVPYVSYDGVSISERNAPIASTRSHVFVTEVCMALKREEVDGPIPVPWALSNKVSELMVPL